MFIYACFSCLRYRLHVIFDPITNSQCLWSKMTFVAKFKRSRHKPGVDWICLESWISRQVQEAFIQPVDRFSKTSSFYLILESVCLFLPLPRNTSHFSQNSEHKTRAKSRRPLHSLTLNPSIFGRISWNFLRVSTKITPSTRISTYLRVIFPQNLIFSKTLNL